MPVFEPGPPFDDLMASLAAQTMPADDFEVLLVDDGSPDDARARAAAAAHGNVRLEHIEHSGWPSRPRNVGLDLARGEFVFFADQDDRLDPEALERLTGRAAEDGADIVVGKVVAHGKPLPDSLFTANRRDVTLEWPPLMRLLTPHKLFRRAFVERHGLRFPEDGRRLEDHVFGLRAYFAGPRVSILADHPIYHWILHGEGENASYRRFDPEDYYGRVRELLDIVDAHTDPGPLRDRLYAYYLRGKLLARLGGRSFLTRDEDYGRALYAAIRGLFLDRFPEGFEDALPFRHRLRARLLRADDADGLRALARFEAELKPDPLLVCRNDRDDAVDLRFEVGLRLGDAPLVVRMRGIGLQCERLLEELDETRVPAAQLDLAEALDRASAALQLVRRKDGSMVPLDSRMTVRLDPLGMPGDRFTPVLVVEATVDPRTAAHGAALPPGPWQVQVAYAIGGFTGKGRRHHDVAEPEAEPRQLVLTIGKDGRLTAPAPPARPSARARVLRRLPTPARATLSRLRRAVA